MIIVDCPLRTPFTGVGFTHSTAPEADINQCTLGGEVLSVRGLSDQGHELNTTHCQGDSRVVPWVCVILNFDVVVLAHGRKLLEEVVDGGIVTRTSKDSVLLWGCVGLGKRGLKTCVMDCKITTSSQPERLSINKGVHLSTARRKMRSR